MKKILSSVFSFLTIASLAQWNSNPAINTPVCVQTGKQVDTRMTDDGHGGVFIAWKDYRAGGIPDIYIQHIDSLGFPVWTLDGVGLCTDPADQSTPSIVTDMAGGAIVSWSDWRSGVERDVYAQRINAGGIVQWTFNGVGVANKVEREHNEKIISDGKGGAIIVWEQQDPGTYWWDIWIQRINSNGGAMWPVGGIPVSTVVDYRLNPKVQSDKRGGVYVTWQDWTGSAYDIIAQHLDSSGNRTWGGAGKVVCAAVGAQLSPKIDPDSISGGVIIAWADKRNGTDYDIYSQRIDSLGNMLWATNGVPVIINSGNQSAVDFLSNPRVGGIIYSWKDSRNGNNNNDIFAQKLDVNGVQQWSASGVALCNSSNDQVNPSITGDGSGGAVIAWQDSSAGQWDVYSQRVDGAGNILWTSNGVGVGLAMGNQTSPKNVSDEAGGCIYAWQDTRSGSADIYVHHIYFNGGNIGIENQKAMATVSCYPNPFENTFTFNFNLAKEEKISLRIFNLMGESVAEIISSAKTTGAGNHSVKINADDYPLPAGIYLLQVSSTGFSKSIKLIKTK